MIPCYQIRSLGRRRIQSSITLTRRVQRAKAFTIENPAHSVTKRDSDRHAPPRRGCISERRPRILNPRENRNSWKQANCKWTQRRRLDREIVDQRLSVVSVSSQMKPSVLFSNTLLPVTSLTFPASAGFLDRLYLIDLTYRIDRI